MANSSSLCQLPEPLAVLLRCVIAKAPADKTKRSEPNLEDFLQRRDFAGAITWLHFKRHGAAKDPRMQEWLAYAHYHFAEHEQALAIYKQLLAEEDPDPVYYTYAAACLYYMGLYGEAESMALQGPRCALQTRILFHCAHQMGDEAKLMQHHQQLSESTEDQLSLASIHYLRGHYQEATDVYKRLLLEHREFLALNVYVALCYSKLDYYDVSLEILAVYLQQHLDSAVAVNLKACNLFKLYTGKAAEAELKGLERQGVNISDNALVRHNLVVFRNGDSAMQVLPPLVGVCPEARLNMAIYHLRRGEAEQAFKVVKDLDPVAPPEYILKGVVYAAVGQQQQSQEYLKIAQQCFQLVGSSATECDTIPGRQCMACCFHLLRQWEDVLVYLSSIRSYLAEDDDFNWNFGIASAAGEQWGDVEEGLLAVRSEAYCGEHCFAMWLAKTHIMQGKPRAAWELYLRQGMSDKSLLLLQLIANQCYQQGQFLYAAKAFDVLERLDGSPEHWEGKQGACVGVLQVVAAGKESGETLREVLALLQNSSQANADIIVRVIRRFAAENRIAL